MYFVDDNNIRNPPQKNKIKGVMSNMSLAAKRRRYNLSEEVFFFYRRQLRNNGTS